MCLHLADSRRQVVSPTFPVSRHRYIISSKKKDENSDMVHHKATRDANMCPVHAAAAIVPEFVTTKTPTTTRQSPQSSHEVEAVMSRRTYPSWDPIYLTASKTWLWHQVPHHSSHHSVWSPDQILVQPACDTYSKFSSSKPFQWTYSCGDAKHGPHRNRYWWNSKSSSF